MNDTLPFDSIADLVKLWPTPSRSTFAADVGVTYGNVQQFERRDFLPPEYWDDTVQKADERGIGGVTLNALAQFAKRRRRTGNGRCANSSNQADA